MTDLVVRKIPWEFAPPVPLTMVWRLALSQTPHHDPGDQPIPDWADTWMREYDRGTDMTRLFGSPGNAER